MWRHVFIEWIRGKTQVNRGKKEAINRRNRFIALALRTISGIQKPDNYYSPLKDVLQP
jgi:hypothetical protein